MLTSCLIRLLLWRFIALFLLTSHSLLPVASAHEGHDHKKPLQAKSPRVPSIPGVTLATTETLATETTTGDAAANAQATPAQLIARGVVFEDKNANGLRDADEPGLAGIKISNGSEIVKTSEQGRYEIEVDDDTIVFIIKPRGYMTPVGEDQLPKFYYVHKPAGSPPDFKYPGVAPTGPLPDSIDFPLVKRDEPEKFRALIFGDTQPRNIAEVEFMAHDIVAQVIENGAHDASFGVTLGDIVFDDLDVMEPHNQAIAMIGIPWYNVIGNHDMNYDAKDDRHSDETFERIYGPSYYSFDHGPTHFLVLDDVTWVGANGDEKGRYFGGLGERQMNFIRNDLATIAPDQLVVLMMHIPLTDVEDRHELFRIIEQRPATVSLSAHTHYMEHRFLGDEQGWQGPEKHHHIINVTVCGSWWRGKRDERGIPHATMSDGGPNGYSIMEFDGANYSLDFRAAGRPAEYQMNIYAPESVAASELAATVVLANVFAGSDQTQCELRLDGKGDWVVMEQTRMADPAFVAETLRDAKLVSRDWAELPKPHNTPHIWRGKLPSELVPGTPVAPGTHVIDVRATWPDGKTHINRRLIRVD